MRRKTATILIVPFVLASLLISYLGIQSATSLLILADSHILRTAPNQGTLILHVNNVGSVDFYLAGIGLPSLMLNLYNGTHFVAGATYFKYELEGDIAYTSPFLLGPSLALKAGRNGTVILRGSFDKTVQYQNFVHITVYTNLGKTFSSRVPCLGLLRADMEKLKTYGPQVLQVLERLDAYLDTRLTSDGWLVTHPSWPEELREEAMAIAQITAGYLALYNVTGNEKYLNKALFGGNWLVKAQQLDGGWGLPWAWDHFDGHSHPANFTYTITTLLAIQSLVDLYRATGEKQFLDAALKGVKNVLDVKGYVILDEREGRGTLVYCSYEPKTSLGRAIEIYNIDGAGITTFLKVYEVTKNETLVKIARGLANNLIRAQYEDGVWAYAPYTQSRPPGYAQMVESGLLDFYRFTGDEKVFWAVLKGLVWLINEGSTDPNFCLIISETLGMNLTDRVIDVIKGWSAGQKPDGSFSGGTATRSDGGMLFSLATLLERMGYREKEE